MAGGAAGIDQEVAVQLRDLRAADPQSAAAGGIDQLPGAFARRILEGRAAGLFANRLRGFAVVLHLVHARADRLGRGHQAAKARGGKDDRGIDAAVAIDELHGGIVEYLFAAVAADAGRFDQHIPGLRTVGASVHAQRAADGAGNAEEKFQPADIGRRRRLGDALVERRRAGADDIAASAGLAEPARAKPDHHARQAAVTHDQVGADADDMDRQFIGQVREEIPKIIFIRWRKQRLRRAADPEPRQLGQRLVRQQPPAQLRHRGLETGRDVGKAHARFLFPPPLSAIGFTHLENRLKNRDLDDPRFWKRLYYGPSANVDKTRVFRTGRPLIKRCVHEIAGDRAFLPPSPRGYVLSKPGWADATPQDLTPASGRQDHTILPYAKASLVSVLVIAHGFF